MAWLVEIIADLWFFKIMGARKIPVAKVVVMLLLIFSALLALALATR